MADYVFPRVIYSDRAPTSADDISDGIVVGQMWAMQTSTINIVYICQKNTTNGAVWSKTSSSWSDITDKPSPKLTLTNGATGTCTFTYLADATMSVTIDPTKHVHAFSQITGPYIFTDDLIVPYTKQLKFNNASSVARVGLYYNSTTDSLDFNFL